MLNKKSIDASVVLADLKKRITSTLSDRAAVNHCFKEIEKFIGHEILDLHCNTHPLDSLSIAFQKLAKKFEAENEIGSSLLGAE